MFPILLVLLPGTVGLNWNLAPVYNRGATEVVYEGLINSSYNKFFPPYDYGYQITVVLAAVYVQLLSVEENRQVVSYIARINMTWQDSRLSFDPNEVGSDFVQLPPNTVWRPSVEFFNCLDNKEQARQKEETPVELRSDGHVSLLWYSKVETICNADVSAFPFDEQWCSFGFSAGLASVEEVLIQTTNDTRNKQGIPEWEMLDVSSSRDYFVQYGRNYSIGEIVFHLKRNPQFYIFFVILPTFVVTATCISAMLLPLDMEIGERVNLGIAGLLSLTFMLSVIVGELPRTPGLPLMGKWVIIEMFFCCSGMVVPMMMAMAEKYVFRERKKRTKRLIMGFVFLAFTIANVLTSVLIFAYPPKQKRAR